MFLLPIESIIYTPISMNLQNRFVTKSEVGIDDFYRLHTLATL
ncbi:MAG: hypothetical protein HLUCCO02_09330 [Idiomarinaceae bacterium HL-53]|nr:MAG: hypothetical protein HLUCCO02_09330 [Idiomarinaceae bacterium HL-53]